MNKRIIKHLKRFSGLNKIPNIPIRGTGLIRQIENILRECTKHDIGDYAFSVSYEALHDRRVVTDRGYYSLQIEILNMYINRDYFLKEGVSNETL